MAGEQPGAAQLRYSVGQPPAPFVHQVPSQAGVSHSSSARCPTRVDLHAPTPPGELV